MPTLHITSREGLEKTVEVQAVGGQSVMEIIRDQGFDEMLALCGGCCSCATCHVYVDAVDAVDAATLPELGSDESDLLSGSQHRRQGSRLACQIPFTRDLGGLRVRIAPED